MCNCCRDDRTPTFIATYIRPDWAYKVIMPCGHSAASYDSAGNCMMCALERWNRNRAKDAETEKEDTK